MRLTDILELGALQGVARFVEKRAGVMLPLAIGAAIPGIAHKAIERAKSTEDKLDAATGNPFKTAALPPWLALPLAQMSARAGQGASAAGRGAMGVGKTVAEGAKGGLGNVGASPFEGIAKGISGGIGKRVENMFGGREFGEKKDVGHMMGGEAIKTFGKEMGSSGANLLRDMANKAMDAVGHAGDAAARQAILGDLKRTDSVLAGADDTVLMESYHTMTRFAPTLSTDKNAVRSFLRQAVMSGSGPDFMTIKHLADSERAVTGEKDRR